MNKSRTGLRIFTATTVILGALLAAAPIAGAQEEELSVQVVQVDESRFPEIDVYVSVTDTDGEPVTNLTQESFQLEENKKIIPLTGFEQAGEQGPVTAVLAIDKSGSMKTETLDKMQPAKEAAIAFVDLMRPGDATGVIAFDTEITIVQSLTETKESLVAAIESIEIGSDTALYDALHAASEMLEPVSGRKAIIAVTDGMNTAGERTLEETLTLVGEQGVSVYTIGLGDPEQGTDDFAGIDQETLQTIAETSNGIYQFTPEPAYLSELYETLSYRLQNEYKLTYESPTPRRDGVRRDVVVNIVSDAGSTVVEIEYNPGGVIPEVEQRSTWGLFGLILAVLVVLLVVPGIIGRVRTMATGGAKAKRSVKGRVRLTGDSSSSRKKKRRR